MGVDNNHKPFHPSPLTIIQTHNLTQKSLLLKVNISSLKSVDVFPARLQNLKVVKPVWRATTRGLVPTCNPFPISAGDHLRRAVFSTKTLKCSLPDGIAASQLHIGSETRRFCFFHLIRCHLFLLNSHKEPGERMKKAKFTQRLPQFSMSRWFRF